MSIASPHPALRLPSVSSDQERLQQLRMQGGLLEACVNGVEEAQRQCAQAEDPAQVVETVYRIAINWLKKAPELFSEFQCPENIEQLSSSELAECAARVNDLAFERFVEKFCKKSFSDLRQRIAEKKISPSDFLRDPSIFNFYRGAREGCPIPLELIPLNWDRTQAVMLLEMACDLSQPIEPFRSFAIYSFGEEASSWLYKAVCSGDLEIIQSFRTWPNREKLPLQDFWRALSRAYQENQLSIFQELKKWEQYQRIPLESSSQSVDELGLNSLCRAVDRLGLDSLLLASHCSPKKEMLEELLQCPRIQSLFQKTANYYYLLEEPSRRERLPLYQRVPSVPNRAPLSSVEFGDLLYASVRHPEIFCELFKWPELDTIPLRNGPPSQRYRHFSYSVDLCSIRGDLDKDREAWSAYLWEYASRLERRRQSGQDVSQELAQISREKKDQKAMGVLAQKLDDLIQSKESEELARQG